VTLWQEYLPLRPKVTKSHKGILLDVNTLIMLLLNRTQVIKFQSFVQLLFTAELLSRKEQIIYILKKLSLPLHQMNHYKNKRPINQWAEDDRPREKMLNKGKNSLSDAELILARAIPANRQLNYHKKF